jgi:hypothetical protein
VIVIEHDDHKSKTFRTNAKKVGQTNVHAALIRKLGTLEIITEPAGAKVFVDEKEWGLSPLTKTKLARKKYLVEIEKKGFKKEAIEADLLTESTDVLVVSLKKNVAYGTLDVSAHPWAKVYIDGKLVAESTPKYGLRVEEGEHIIRFENPRLNKSVERKIVIKKDEKESLVVKLR